MNKKQIIVVIIILCTIFHLSLIARQASLPIIDTSVLRSWNSLVNGTGIISNNGLYAGYSISNSVYTLNTPDQLIFKSLKGDWEVQLDSIIDNAFFTGDSKLGIVLLKNNHLCIQELGENKREIIPGVKSFMLQTINKQEYLIYFRIGSDNEFIIRNLKNKTERRYKNILKYNFSAEGDICYITSKEDGIFKVDILQVSVGIRNNIWQGRIEPLGLISDKAGNQVCFLVDSILFYWNRNSGSDVQTLSPFMEGDCKDLAISEPAYFSPTGKLLFVRMRGMPLPSLKPDVNPVQIFSYQDGIFDIDAERIQRTYLGVYEISTRKLTRLEQDNDAFRSISRDEDIAWVVKKEGAPMEYYWNRMSCIKDYIVNLRTGQRLSIERKSGDLELSPSGKYVIYQNDRGGDFYRMDVSTGNIINMTKNLSIPLIENVDENPMGQYSRGFEFYNFLEDNKSVIVYDRYDIWLLDLSGKKVPVNLTHGYGRKHHTVFRFYQLKKENKIKKIGRGEAIICAFNEETKDNGFYSIKGIGERNPSKLIMDKCVYLAPGQAVWYVPPIKASEKKVWLVWRMSAREAANYYWTTNFKKFKAVSNIHPERRYQWYTTELINFKTKDGINTQAVLYKPDNFDSTQKYPVLFNYYERESAKLNAYRIPNITDGYCFNYPMMLAKGYLICLTDIHFVQGKIAQNIVDAVEGAGDYLSKLRYVDSSHYGICGGSFAGYATNCLATFSHRFAAAVSISSRSDLVGGYGNVPGLRDENVENRQYRIGVSLSTAPERYLRNSPVAYTKSVTTPLLLVNTTMDWNVNVQQGIELFISLRREGKPTWMLRYQHTGHGIGDLEDQRDLYTRMNQFFDHYLKGIPATVWMTQGIPINETSVKSGFEYDKEFPKPLPSSLIFK